MRSPALKDKFSDHEKLESTYQHASGTLVHFGKSLIILALVLFGESMDLLPVHFTKRTIYYLPTIKFHLLPLIIPSLRITLFTVYCESIGSKQIETAM
jgi:hypothetical protein